MSRPEVEIVLLAGMSGAGRTTATRALEDLGWWVIDNLPVEVLQPAMQAALAQGVERMAITVDVRGATLFNDMLDALALMRDEGYSVRIVFLEANDEVLVRRFESSRRPHPLQGSGTPAQGIAIERQALADVRGDADLVIDTSSLNVHDLRRKIEAAFDDPTSPRLRATVMSFGFKYGIPVDADIVADMRFLPNPYWVPELRELTGQDLEVSDYVTSQPAAQDFCEKYLSLLDVMSDGYLREGKRYVTIAIGCTGGKHRSVAMSEYLGSRLVKDGMETLVVHRDLGRE